MIFSLSLSFLVAKCQGRFINPFTDISWSCVFPITIGGINVTPSHKDFEQYKPTIFCNCGLVNKFGLKVSFWEPIRLIDITRSPYCLIGLGGIEVSKSTVKKHGGTDVSEDTNTASFYHAHWYIYPLIYWLELLTDFECVSKGKVDIGYLTEFDPLWQDDEWSFIQNPEAGFFVAPPVQLACTADCVTATANHPINKLFWCAGCLGSLYPFVGKVGHHIGGIQASSLLVMRLLAKFHGLNVVKGYEIDDFCEGHYRPRVQKTIYKTHLAYPTNAPCQPLGKSDALWGSGKSYPYGGEDFCYLLFKKTKCCLGIGFVPKDNDF